jgi:hypothetical protein
MNRKPKKENGKKRETKMRRLAHASGYYPSTQGRHIKWEQFVKPVGMENASKCSQVLPKIYAVFSFSGSKFFYRTTLRLRDYIK